MIGIVLMRHVNIDYIKELSCLPALATGVAQGDWRDGVKFHILTHSSTLMMTPWFALFSIEMQIFLR